ncbi:MAG: histidinol-phosphate transaminase [Calditrichaeota bacterium]|nr:MAG: histidinol-phosphate transaminase [Calditrichota bacterium]
MSEMTALIRRHIREMAPYQPIEPVDVLAKKLGLAEAQIIKLDANENPYGLLPEIEQTLQNLRYVHQYPDPESRALRRALAEYHHLSAEHFLVGAGADELIDLVTRLFLGPGDGIIHCPPTFGMYAFDAQLQGARIISVPRKPDFSLDLPAIRAAVLKHQPRIIFVASPNNPDGQWVPPGVLQQLLELPLMVVVDEAYVEFAHAFKGYLHQVPLHDNLIVLRTFSKWAGLAGIRLGYGAFPRKLLPYLWKIKQPYNVSVAATSVGIAALKQADKLHALAAKIRCDRDKLMASLQRFRWLRPYPSEANFILCRVAEPPGAGALKQHLALRGIFVRYFQTPELQDCIRITVGTPEQNEILLQHLQEFYVPNPGVES